MQPTSQPSRQPSTQPSRQPSCQPSRQPSFKVKLFHLRHRKRTYT
jgi:hypothetical protein